MRSSSSVTSHRILLTIAASALLLIGYRAATQSISIDEADTFNVFVARALRYAWYPAANNHVLNTLLINLTTTVFGASEFTIRLPAFLGSVRYILGALGFCKSVVSDSVHRIIACIVLIFNPLVLDYLVAARGYSLASGLMLCALALACRVGLVPPSHRVATMHISVVSLLIGLSITANFSFAFINSAFLLLFYLSVHRQRMSLDSHIRHKRLTLALACGLPALLTVGILTGPTLFRWNHRELSYGAKSLADMLTSVWEASFYELPAFLRLHQGVFSSLHHTISILIPIVCTAAAVVYLLVTAARADSREHNRGRLRLLGIIGGSLLVATCAHWICFRVAGIPLPKDRTAIWLVILYTLLLTIVMGSPRSCRVSIYSGHILALTMAVCALSFLVCLRISYFKEWKWNADMRHVYSVVATYNHDSGAKKVSSHWLYSSSLECYRQLSGRESLNEIIGTAVPQPDREIYILQQIVDDGYMRREGLQPLYYGPVSALVAVRSPNAPVTDISFFSASTCRGADGCSLYDDTDAGILWSGTWVHSDVFIGAANGTVSYSNSPGSSFVFRFKGRVVTLGYTGARNRGIAEVLLDSRTVGELDLYSPMVRWQAHASFMASSAGNHTLEVRVSGRKNQAAEDRYVDVDVVRVE